LQQHRVATKSDPDISKREITKKISLFEMGVTHTQMAIRIQDSDTQQNKKFNT
jgi:hypothetical protein